MGLEIYQKILNSDCLLLMQVWMILFYIMRMYYYTNEGNLWVFRLTIFQRKSRSYKTPYFAQHLFLVPSFGEKLRYLLSNWMNRWDIKANFNNNHHNYWWNFFEGRNRYKSSLSKMWPQIISSSLLFIDGGYLNPSLIIVISNNRYLWNIETALLTPLLCVYSFHCEIPLSAENTRLSMWIEPCDHCLSGFPEAG